MISMVAAMDKNRVIGLKGELPWGRRMKNDIARYLETIKGKSLIMGRKTYELSHHGRKQVQKIIVLSRSDFDVPEGVTIAHSPEEAMDMAGDEKEVMVTGGGIVFELMMPYADKLYLTIIDHEFEGDTYFPDWSKEHWETIEDKSYPKDNQNDYPYKFLTLLKK